MTLNDNNNKDKLLQCMSLLHTITKVSKFTFILNYLHQKLDRNCIGKNNKIIDISRKKNIQQNKGLISALKYNTSNI